MAENEALDGPEPKTIERRDGATIAYHRSPGKVPGVVFLTGYMSDMTGGKALRLEHFCRVRRLAYLRFDYFGHGASSGAFTDGTIGRWADDALAVIDELTDGPQILIGSSMGGWIMLVAGRARPDRLAGMIGIAAAPDFSQDIWLNFNEAQRTAVQRDGSIALDEDGETLEITNKFIQDGRQHLMLRAPIDIACPVRLLQGMQDTAVPWRTALTLADRLTGDDVIVTLIKDGDHRLSRDQDLARLAAIIDELSR